MQSILALRIGAILVTSSRDPVNLFFHNDYVPHIASLSRLFSLEPAHGNKAELFVQLYCSLIVRKDAKAQFLNVVRLRLGDSGAH